MTSQSDKSSLDGKGEEQTLDEARGASGAGKGQFAEGVSLEDEVEPWGAEDPVIPPNWRPVIPAVMLVILFLIASYFFDEFIYVLSPSVPVDLGDSRDGCEEPFYRKIEHNRLVKVRGVIPQPGMVVKARVNFRERYYVVALGCELIISLSGERYRQLFSNFYEKPLLIESGRDSSIFRRETVQAEAKRGGGLSSGAGKMKKYGPDWIEGRAVKILRYHNSSNIRRFYTKYFGLEFTENSYLIRDGEYPGESWWLLILFAVLFLLVVYNIISIWRATREWIEFKRSLRS